MSINSISVATRAKMTRTRLTPRPYLAEAFLAFCLVSFPLFSPLYQQEVGSDPFVPNEPPVCIPRDQVVTWALSGRRLSLRLPGSTSAAELRLRVAKARPGLALALIPLAWKMRSCSTYLLGGEFASCHMSLN